MTRKWFGLVCLAVTATALVVGTSCGDPQELVSITIQPSTETFGASNIPISANAGAQVQLRALGAYIHPPVTKDITGQVTWSSNTPQMFTVDTAGLLTATGLACGGTLVSATVQTNKTGSGLSASGAVVTGYMSANVVCPTATTTGPAVSVTFSGSGQGTVASSPAGINCASTTPPCVGSFASGTSVMLTATALGTFGGWTGGCSTISGSVCTIDNVTADVTVNAQFN